MTRTAATTPAFLPAPRAGRSLGRLHTARSGFGGARREGGRWVGLAEVAAGAALLALWALLWSFLVGGVIAPASKLTHSGRAPVVSTEVAR
jgi:hypothetical protein